MKYLYWSIIQYNYNNWSNYVGFIVIAQQPCDYRFLSQTVFVSHGRSDKKGLKAQKILVFTW